MAKYRQGLYRPKNKEKYIGNTEHIVYRSFLEFRVMTKLDMDSDITKWASEEFFIPYISPIDKIAHRYYVDLYFEKRDKTKYICEVKPYEQTKPPTTKGRKLLKESVTFANNLAKWSSAAKWAKQRGCKFIIWTERDLNG